MCFISASPIPRARPDLVEALLWGLVQGLCVPTSGTHVNRSTESWNNVMGAGGRWCRKGEASCAESEAGEGREEENSHLEWPDHTNNEIITF